MSAQEFVCQYIEGTQKLTDAYGSCGKLASDS